MLVINYWHHSTHQDTGLKVVSFLHSTQKSHGHLPLLFCFAGAQPRLLLRVCGKESYNKAYTQTYMEIYGDSKGSKPTNIRTQVYNYYYDYYYNYHTYY